MTRIDLHTHTLKSDGELSPAELVAAAAKKDISVLAITDHDSLAGLDEGERAAEEYGLKFVPGIEVSAMYGGVKEVHLLGLFIDRTERALLDAVEDWAKSRRERNREMLARFSNVGVDMDMHRLLRLSGVADEISITRAHFARALVDAGYCATTGKAFVKYLSPGTPTYVRRRVVSATDAIDIIRRAGGLPILAHPLRYRLELPEAERMIERLADDGLLGLECYYTTHNTHEQESLLKIAKKYRLCVSGGSDFHGFSHDDVELGTGRGRLYVPYSVYEALQRFKHQLALVNRS